MPVLNVLQPSFAAGELSPLVWGRVDLAKFHVGCRVMENFLVHAQGGASNRPGFRYIGTVDDSTKRHRLIPFEFRTLPTGQTYALVFGDLNLQVVMNNGTSIGLVQLGTATITAITQANPGVVTTSAAHGFTTGTIVPLAGIVGMTQLNGQRVTATVIDATHFSIGVDTTAYTAYSSGGTAGGGNYTLTTPYTYADLPTLKFVQSADTMTITHTSYAPRKLTRTGNTAWSLSTITFAPTTAAPTGLVAGTPGAGGSVLVVTAIDGSTGEESIASASASSSVAGHTDSWTWNAVTGATIYNVYKQSGSVFGFIAQVSTNSFTEANLAPSLANQPSTGSTNPFSGAGKYPGATGYYMQRQWYGDTTDNPGGLFSSQAGAFSNMNVSTPTQDSDAITRTLVSGHVDEIRHLMPVGTSMLILTSGAEWRCWPGQNSAALTPGSCYTIPQSDHGSSHVPPFWTENTLLMFQENGATVQALRYDAIADVYQSQDMGILASHLFTDVGGNFQIQERAWAAVPNRICWCVRSDGTLLGFTYMREQDVYAWHRHTTDGVFESVCSVTEPDGYGGYEDAVYVIVKRTIGGQTARYIERLVSRTFPTIADAWFVDCGLQYSGTPVTSVSGLDHLEGKTVAILGDGSVVPSQVVTGGAVTLDGSYSKVTVGLPYTSTLTTLNMEIPGAPTTQGEPKKISQIAVSVKDTRGASVGIEQEVPAAGLSGTPKTVEIKQRWNQALGTPMATFTGTYQVNVPTEWQRGGRMAVQQVYPLPVTILGLVPSVLVGD